MDLHRLHWLTVLVPAVALGLCEVVRHWFLERRLSSGIVSLLVTGVVVGGSYLFSRWIFGILFEMDHKTKQQAKRARAMLEVARTVNSSLDVKTILQYAVDLAREHVEADHGEIHYMKSAGEHGVRFSGLREGECLVRQRPTLRGLNGEVLRTGRPLRLADRRDHPHSVPLPEGHPPIGPFLGVPIIVRGRVEADILLTRVPGREPFTQEDEDFLLTIANQTAVAIENARLYEQVCHVATLEERDRLGREMHDGLAQTLGYLNLRTRAIVDLMNDGQVGEACAMLDDMHQVVKEAYEDVRRVIFDLRSGPDLDLGFVPALRKYLYEFGLQTQIATELVIEGEDHFDPPPEVEVQLIRIIQEALTNVRRHAHARHVWVRIEANGMNSHVIVEDDGVGIKEEDKSRQPKWPHFGLQTMRERAESVGGHLEIEPRSGGGTRVMVTIPTCERRVQATAGARA